MMGGDGWRGQSRTESGVRLRTNANVTPGAMPKVEAQSIGRQVETGTDHQVGSEAHHVTILRPLRLSLGYHTPARAKLERLACAVPYIHGYRIYI